MSLPYPVETLRHWYVTPFGGYSGDLAFLQVGIRREALDANTELDPQVDRVRIGVLGVRHARPVLMDAVFEVVPLDASRPDALARSPGGEAVLPEGDAVVRKPFPEPARGDAILLNGVAAKRFPTDPERLAEVIGSILEQGREDRPAS